MGRVNHVLVAGMVVAAAAMLQQRANAQAPLRLSTLLPITGTYANYAVEFKLGFEIARDEINAKGGIAGHQLDLEIIDTQSNNAQLVSLVRQACSDSFAVLGPSMSNEAQVAFPVANSIKCPAISSAATATGLTDRNRPWTFTYASPAQVITPAAVAFLADKLKPKKAVVVIDRGDAAANAQGPLAEKALKDKGIDTEALTVSSNDLDFGPIVTRIAGLNPDLVVLSTIDKGATVECNPRFGPAAFKAAMDYAKGEKIPPVMTNKDNFYDISNAAASIAGSY